MSLFKSNLHLMRQEWHNAFYNADTEQLDYLETEWFLATNGQKLLYKKHQLKKIAMTRSANYIVKNNRREFDVTIREFKGIACVCGIAEVAEGETNTRIHFIENWIKINEGWKLQFVSFESD